jgi:transcriptional regulator with XRE-family HTH domain
MHKELEERSDWLSWTGLTQRKIAQAAGVSQSTVSENKTFLVKSAKLVREVGEGGLALVKDAEPSLWHSGDALLGFPKPDEVRAWWAGNDPTPPSPEGADRADHEPIITNKRTRRRVIGGQRQAIERLPIGKTAC